MESLRNSRYSWESAPFAVYFVQPTFSRLAVHRRHCAVLSMRAGECVPIEAREVGSTSYVDIQTSWKTRPSKLVQQTFPMLQATKLSRQRLALRNECIFTDHRRPVRPDLAAKVGRSFSLGFSKRLFHSPPFFSRSIPSVPLDRQPGHHSEFRTPARTRLSSPPPSSI